MINNTIDNQLNNVLFNNLKQSQRNALFALICLHLPVEARNNDLLPEKCWSYEFLSILLTELELPETFLEAYSQLVDRIYINPDSLQIISKESKIKPFLEEIMNLPIDDVVHSLLSLMVLLVLREKYDARGRTLMRNLLYTLSHSSLISGGNNNLSELSTSFTLADAEEYIIKSLEEKYKQVTKNSKIGDSTTSTTSSTSSTLIRIAQIGVVSIGTGAILALTGGLAAPALAAIWGMSFLGTAGVCASLFGGAGAGLAAYKMTKRTRGITEFKFESPDDAKHLHGRLSVMIMVSGFLFKNEDQKRAFGLIPDTIESDERLVRYYRVHAPEKIPDASREAKEHYRDITKFYKLLTERYGYDPTKSESLAPPYIDSYLPQAYKTVIDQLLLYYIQVLSDSNNRLKQSNSVSISKSQSNDDTFDNIPYKFTNPSDRCATINELSNESKVINKDSNNDSNNDIECITLDESNDIISDLPIISARQSNDIHNTENDSHSLTSDFEDLDFTHDERPVDEVNQSIAPPQHELTAEESFIIETSFGSKLWHWREVKFSSSYEPYVLTWETSTQIDLGNNIARMVYNLGVYTTGQVLVSTLFYSLATAIMLPATLLSLTASIDGVWTMAILRADLAGVELAKALIARPKGSRPVTLVGYSIGARVIFSCLKELFLMRYCHLMNEHTSIFSSNSNTKGTSPSSSNNLNELNSKSKPKKKYFSMFHSKSKNNDEIKQEEDYDEWKIYNERNKIKNVYNISNSLDDECNDDVNDEIFNNVHYSIPIDKSKSSNDEALPSNDIDNDIISRNESSNQLLNDLPMELDINLVDESIRGIENIIQDVVLLGAPIRYKSKFWKWIRMVVSGRIINGFSKNDLILGLVYRYQRFGSAVSGVEPVPCPGIENIDLSHIIDKHVDYSKNIREIMEYIDLTQPNLPEESSHVDI